MSNNVKTGDTITTEYTYDLSGNLLTSTTDDSVTAYTYDKAGRTLLINADGTYQRTVYDNHGRVVQEIDNADYNPELDNLPAAYGDINAGHRYVYAENGNLASETNRLGVTTTYDYYPNSSDVKTESFDIYVFTYDQKGNTTKVTVSGETYADYAYSSENNPTLVSYGNGQSVRYEYDAHNNLTAQYHNDDTSAYVVYTYKVIENTADSETAESTDTDYSSEFEQDPEVTINTNEEYTLASKVNYDTSRATYYDGDTVTVKSIADDGTETVIYSYSNSETENSRTVTDTYQSGATVTMTTDIDSAVDTFTQSGTGSLATFTSYSSEMDENTNTATSYIKNADGNTIITSNMTYDDNGNVISEEFILNGSTITYTYTYDDKGRMTSCDYGNGSKSEYAYDANGALIKYNEIYNDNGTKYLYEYDSRGNLNKWIITGLADESGTDADAGITTYETNNQIWLDGITLVDYGEEEYRYTTDYDGSGNPDSYVDYRYDWSSGRNLESVSSTATGTEKLVSRFTYDEKGIRAEKISSAGNKNEYLTKDGRITSEYAVNNRGKISSEIVYLYDSNDNLIGFNNQNNTCFYVRNYMGDVMGIVDSDGVWLAKYQYDAWGKMISSRINDEDFDAVTTAARKSGGNNMLYRGYYYDTATEMYYLQSRYYSPDQFRFLNPDLPEYAKELKDDYAGTNLFAYCGNDPINRVDYHGYKYDHRKAMQYAERWWNSYNVYKYKTNKDADCANFVSQCLYAGGFAKMDNVWYHRVYSWTDTHSTIPEYRYVVNGAKISLTWGLALELGKWLYRKVGSSNVVMIRKYKNDRYKLDQVGKYLHGKGRCNAVALLRWTDYKGNQHVHIVITGMVVQVYRGKSIYQIYFYGHTNAAGGTSKYSKSLKYFYDRTDIKNQSINIYYIK